MIKVVKKVICVIFCNVDVNDEELMIVFVGVEVLMNFCLFMYQLVDFRDVMLFIFNYFFYGQMGGVLVLELVDEVEFSLRNRWR